MQFGFCLPTFSTLGARDAILHSAELAEQDGWDSVWVTDHVLMQTGTPTPYAHLYEALTTLSFVAGMTRRVKLGTSILVLPQRNAIVVAKQIAALDALSAGRMILGVGAGWNEKEFEYLGADFHRRGKRLEEQIAVMRALWTQEQPAFEGRDHHFADTVFSPKPAQTRLPIWIGGNSEPAARRAARLGDGWHITGTAPARAREIIDALRPQIGEKPFTFSARVETDPTGKLPVQFAGPDGSPRRRLSIAPDDAARDIETYRAAGIEYLVIVFMGDSAEKMYAHSRILAREVLPRFR
ncbi:MAG: LLM class F420-dependent oxidoreductase [Chloroflexi bacterium]|nr:LLM class F420-dependent oxidoreductase [Chloroflexota bacterium]